MIDRMTGMFVVDRRVIAHITIFVIFALAVVSSNQTRVLFVRVLLLVVVIESRPTQQQPRKAQPQSVWRRSTTARPSLIHKSEAEVWWRRGRCKCKVDICAAAELYIIVRNEYE